MTARLFGTDGVRGIALHYPLDRPTVTRLGRALAAHLEASGRPLRVLLAGDTRASTAELAAWVGGAFQAAGGEVVWAGVLPTPAVSHLVRAGGGFGTGIIVSASHNPAADNGIKLVTGSGMKWPADDERALEARIHATLAEPEMAPLARLDPSLHARYVEILVGTLPERTLAGLHLVIDAAHGAAAEVAGLVFARLGAVTTVLNAAPDGTNINLGCGALHPEGLAREVVARGADAGVALDGDADRAILVTRTGRVLDGDDVLDLWARHLQAVGQLPGHTLVATVMSNIGLALACRRRGLHLVRCAVGDREVWETMRREGAALGGEQSGHVICAHHAVTGDGLLTAAHVLAAVHAAGQGLEELANLEHFPQVLLNVRVGARRPLAEVPSLEASIRAHEQRLGDDGRVLVRYSGTEPLLRIMVEAPSDAEAQSTAEAIADDAIRHLR